MNRLISRIRNGLKLDGRVDKTGVTTILENTDGILLATGATVPADAEAGYATGALFIDTNGGVGASLFINEGSNSSCDFNLVGLGSGSVSTAIATASGATTGTISPLSKHVTVTSDDANKIVILPAPVIGKQLVINVGATGFELRSSDPATIGINGGVGASAESAIPANSTLFLTCVSLTSWKGYFMDADGDLAKIEVAA